MTCRIALFLVVIALMVSCNEQPSNTPIEEITIDTVAVAQPEAVPDTSVVSTAVADNSFNALDWAGNYGGVLPCADCEGIQTVITLSKNLTYEISTQYLGKSDRKYIQKGTFEWNAAGNSITLIDVQKAPAKYLVGEEHLIKLDALGNRISGKLADKYVLKKQIGKVIAFEQKSTTAIPVTETKWILKELMGKPVEYKKDYWKVMFIQLRASDNRVVVYAGCNNMSGDYELFENNKIKFSNMLSTKMACSDMSVEDNMNNVLKQASSYLIKDSTLQLLKGRMAPLAKFEAEQSPKK